LVELVQETLLSQFSVLPGLGLTMTDQTLPFQDSTRVLFVGHPALP
jgi:hypothetical protein